MVTAIDVLEGLLELASSNRLKCAGCGEAIADKAVTISMYLHDDGIPLREGCERRVWIYVECPRCGYQSSAKRLLVEAGAR